MNKNIAIIVLSILVLILGYFSISRNEKIVYESKVKYDTVVISKDTIIYKKIVKPYRVDSIRVDTIKIPEDSLLIQKYKQAISELLVRKYYKDTLYNDSLSIIILEEECYRNTISNRKLGLSLGTKEITKTVTIDKTPKWSMGIGVVGNIDLFAPSLTVTNKNVVYLGGYDLLHHNIMFGVFYNFRLK